MITLITIKYLFYFWLVLYFILLLFGKENRVNEYFIYLTGIFLLFLYEFFSSSGISILGILGLLVNLLLIFASAQIIKEDKKDVGGYILTGSFVLLLIYLLNK